MSSSLIKLHYHPKWLEYRLIDQAFLDGQVNQFESGGDDNFEHYRYAAFRKVLVDQPTLDDLTLDRYVELAQLDEDQGMAHAVLGLLIKHEGLSEGQLNRIKTHQMFATTSLQSLILQAELLRELDSSDLKEALFERCVLIGKSEVQRKLLSKSGISLHQLAVLIDRGANRAIRNLANQMLQRHLKSV